MRKPYIRISHIVTEIASFLFLLGSIIYAVVKAASIDGDIPTHYNLQGEIDGYGSPYNLLILPLIMLATMILLSLVMHLVPVRYWNMPFKVNQERAVQVYSDMAMMIPLIEIFSAVYTLFETILFTNPKHSSLGITFVYVGLLTVAIVVQVVKAKKHNRPYGG